MRAKPKINPSAAESKVTSVNHQDLTFTLNLVRSDKTFNNPEQQWSFVSNYAVTDYSGDYQIELLPCTVPADRAFTDPPKCKLNYFRAQYVKKGFLGLNFSFILWPLTCGVDFFRRNP